MDHMAGRADLVTILSTKRRNSGRNKAMLWYKLDRLGLGIAF